MNTFTKFDQLGSCLTELSFESVSLGVSRNDDGSISHYTVYLHPIRSRAYHGSGDTPSAALAMALDKAARDPLNVVEAKAAELAA